MRRFLFLLSALVFTLTLAFFPGCGGGDDDDNPGGPGDGDTLTTEEVLTTLEDLGGAFSTVYDDCQTTYIINGLLNLSGAGTLFAEILSGILTEDPEFDMADYYGTWDLDTSTVNPLDMALVDSIPTDAVKIMVIGVDTLGGGNYPGDITIYDLLLGQDLDTVYVHAALHEYGSGDSLAIALDGSLNTGMLSISGNACGLTFQIDFELDQTDTSATISGWYDYPGDPKVYFEVSGDLSGDTTLTDATGTIHIWTTEAPTIDVTVNVVNDPANCVTGEIKINGQTEATIYATDCDTENPNIFVSIDGQTFTLEDLVGELYTIIMGIDPNDLGGALKQGFALTPVVGKIQIERFERLVK